MKNHHFIRFIVVSYNYLQGLTVVPLGLGLMLAAIWANALQRRAEPLDILFISICQAILLLLSWLISRYYDRTFGKNRITKKSQWFEIVSSLIGLGLAFGALWLDVTSKLPFSAIGLVFALALLFVYFKSTWAVKGKYLLVHLIISMIIVLISVLPLLGLSRWWEIFGFRSQLYGVITIAGFLYVVVGIWSHIFLMRVLSPVVETEHV